MSDHRDHRRRSGRINEQQQQHGAPNYNPDRRGGHNNQRGGQPSGGGRGQGNNSQQGGQPSGSNRPGSNAGSRLGSNPGSRPGSNAGSRPGSDAGSRRGSNAGSQQGGNSPGLGLARPISQVPGDRPPSNMYQPAGSGQRQSGSPGNRSPGFEILSRTPSPFQRSQPASGSAQRGGPSGSSGQQAGGSGSGGGRVPYVPARGGPGKSVGGRFGPQPAQAQRSPSVEVDDDIEITGSRQIPQLPAAMRRIEADTARLSRNNGIHGYTMQILRTEHEQGLWPNHTLEELMVGQQYQTARNRVLAAIRQGRITEEHLARFGGNQPDNGGSGFPQGGGRGGGGAGGAAGGAVSA